MEKSDCFLSIKEMGITLIIPNIQCVTDVFEGSEYQNCSYYKTYSSFKVDGHKFEYRGETIGPWHNGSVPEKCWKNSTKKAQEMREKIMKAVEKYWEKQSINK